MGDPYSDGLNDLGDIPQHYLKEIEHFFQVYKDLEGTRTETRGFEMPLRLAPRSALPWRHITSKFGA